MKTTYNQLSIYFFYAKFWPLSIILETETLTKKQPENMHFKPFLTNKLPSASLIKNKKC